MLAVQWVTWLVAGPLTGRTIFDSRPIHMGFVTDKSGTRKYFYPIPRFYPVSTIPFMLQFHISFISYGGYFLPPPWNCSPPAFQGLLIFTRFLDHTQRRTTVGRTPLDEWSAHRRDLYLTTHNRQTSMPPAWFEPTISAGERPQTYALDRAATGTGNMEDTQS